MSSALPDPFFIQDQHYGADFGFGGALFTTRFGGVSHGDFESLNLGPLTDDDPVSVTRNHQLIASQIGLRAEDLLFGRQVHGCDVAITTDRNPHPGSVDADGQLTSLSGRAAMAFSADCPIVLLVSEHGVGAIHAGWRGLAAGVVESGIRAIETLGATTVTAAIGPAARGCCYEVSEEVQTAFADYDARRGERNLDLIAVVKQKLLALGVNEIADIGMCTICNSETFFSHRGNGPRTGRQAGLVWRN